MNDFQILGLATVGLIALGFIGLAIWDKVRGKKSSFYWSNGPLDVDTDWISDISNSDD